MTSSLTPKQLASLTVEEADRANASADDHLAQVLSGALAPFSVDYENLVAEEVVALLNDLLATKDAFERKAKDVLESLERALPFVRGEAVSFNGVGILQMSGIAIDQLAMLFVKQREYSMKALRRYYRHEIVRDALAAAAATADRRSAAQDELVASLLAFLEKEFGPGSTESCTVVGVEREEGLDVRVIFTDGSVRTYHTDFDGSIGEVLSQEEL